jgi:hypothetical protein
VSEIRAGPLPVHGAETRPDFSLPPCRWMLRKGTEAKAMGLEQPLQFLSDQARRWREKWQPTRTVPTLRKNFCR